MQPQYARYATGLQDADTPFAGKPILDARQGSSVECEKLSLVRILDARSFGREVNDGK